RIWLPTRTDSNVTVAGDFTYSSVARLAPGVAAEAAQRDLASALPRIAEIFPQLESGTPTAAWLKEAGPTPVVVPLRDEVTSGIARTFWMIAPAAGFGLFAAGANVANLMLTRGDGRQLELAVREALGASRLRIIGHFLGESLLLSPTAGVIA